MYNKELKSWTAECSDEELMEKYRAEQDHSSEAKFYVADKLLSEAKRGDKTADAVYLMEMSANTDFEPAVLAMAQMFRYGHGVKKNIKTALMWYQKAAALGNKEAADIASSLKRKKKAKIGIFVLLTALIVAAVAMILHFANGAGVHVLVDRGVEVKQPVSAEEFATELAKLIREYDDEQVISGQRSTNRLLLRFEGDKLDLRGFLADKVILQEDNRLVVQFSSEEEAKRCLDILKKMENIDYVEEDNYENSVENTVAKTTGQHYDQKLVSKYSGRSYYSWGVQDLQLDRLAAWIEKNINGNSVVVAVVDSGVYENDEMKGRLLPGFDLFLGCAADSAKVLDGHGTHVAGIILDATQGLDVKVLPIRIIGYECTAASVTAAGIDYAVDHGADIINLSVGGSPSPYKEDAVKRAVSKGVVFVTAAGNERADTAYFSPARMEECIVVAAHDVNDKTALHFSNYGKSVSVSAPGVDILSYWKDDSNLENDVRQQGLPIDSVVPKGNKMSNGIYLEFSDGTSMAAPHISALAAMIKFIRPNATPEQVKGYIQDYCVNPGDELYYGAGICQAGLLAGF